MRHAPHLRRRGCGDALRHRFPVSWLIQSRLAEELWPTIVDENINGVRVVKSFAAEDQPAGAPGPCRTQRLRWAYVKDARRAGPSSPRWCRTCPSWDWPWSCSVGGYLVVHDRLQVGTILTFSFWIVMLQMPFQMLGMMIMA